MFDAPLKTTTVIGIFLGLGGVFAVQAQTGKSGPGQFDCTGASIVITAPLQAARVGEKVQVTIDVKDLPQGTYLWILANREGSKTTYPQDHLDADETLSFSGRDVEVTIGDKYSQGQRFVISAVLVAPKVHKFLKENQGKSIAIDKALPISGCPTEIRSVIRGKS